MMKRAIWGVLGIMSVGLLAAPAHAQLNDLTNAVGKLAQRVTGKEISTTAAVSGTADVGAVPNASNDKSARVSILDKQTNRRQQLVLVSGQVQTVGTVQVQLTKCLADYSAVLGQDVAWLDVTESAEGNGRSAPWFSGWMFNTYPEVSTLDHPRYDIQLQGCGVKARQVVKATGSAPVIESGPPADTESGGDPYYVPGVDKSAPITSPTAPVQADEEASAPADAEAPAAPTESPATELPAAEPMPMTPTQQEDQGELHRMMDSGTY